MAKEYYKAEYIIINKEKYIGQKNPIYRSSWECRVCTLFDTNPKIIKWGFECVEIPYVNIIDKKIHKYYPDFYVELIDKNNKIKKIIIEVKPYKQTIIPKQPKKITTKSQKRYMIESQTFIINQCKWKYAKEYCNKIGYEFQILTENDIFNEGV